MSVLTGLLTACSGFLLAVLWMDLIFDSQVRSARRREQLTEATLASIAGYYHRATTTSQPMGRLIAAVMVVLLAALLGQGLFGASPGWLLTVSAALAGGPILLALTRTVPNAVRLGQRSGTAVDQTRLARMIYRDHIVCAVSLLAFLVLWLGWPHR
ncbi:hypothetical protein ORI20_04705 [Mycobacterium sp. CVI_P3]|uniref:DUF1772 domain-containing protein n=1 Tax=Mycobacterium pinniadriaticum TaxID=2994102 RepID=A0ABT3S908_9MYCO|nr:hypothetical protein [Mycobacterium pinniadriaticum]MCX2929562.1 hypothetical protein [Mycobacterium pinniadriaticum]MCX2935986.1 hypothetical protein [Mycobacterium pinniadriaticum]